MHSRSVVFVFYIISGILENTSHVQGVEPKPDPPQVSTATENGNDTTSTASNGTSKNDENTSSEQPKKATEDTTPETNPKPTSTQGTPLAPVNIPAPISLPTILNTRGGGPFGPAVRNPYLVRHACKFFGNSCLPPKSCKNNWRLPLLGCRKNEVCCNSRKTRNCSKLGGKCRNGCRNYGVPYPVATCKIKWEKCCIRVQ
ncbi:uncharacterized protein [Dermacentor andersoni]|uniref:uncharacterized protein isoform X2 n=1 Tax=Dermacentor andersoni TaxID=34620 RepID=UPI002415E51F|nr:uncharacterized protein LOC126537722 isoform X2 [Dermacentor andersoni]